MQNKIINKNILREIIVRQKDIVIMMTTVIVTFFVFGLFIYSPKHRQMQKIKFEYEAIKNDIKQIETLVGRELDVSLTGLDQRLKKLEKKLPHREEEALKEISAFANHLGLEVVSLTPRTIGLSPIKGEIAGYKCMELPIDIDLRCTYKTLGEYLEMLERKAKTMIRVKTISMSKEQPGNKTNPALRVHILLNTYMLQPQ